jgi:hypothetical protein
MTQIIGMTGRAQHGKDSSAKFLIAKNGFKRYAFADQLRSMALAIDPFVIEEPSPRHRFYSRLSEIVAADGWDAAKQIPEVRRLLQVIGTEGVRDHIGEMSWVNACALKIERDAPERVVVTDVRFPNEADWVHDQGGTLVKIVRVNGDGSPFDNGVPSEHASEANVDKMPVDATLFASTLDELEAQVDGLAVSLEL